MSGSEYIWDYLNPYQYMEKVRTGFPPLIISVATSKQARRMLGISEQPSRC